MKTESPHHIIRKTSIKINKKDPQNRKSWGKEFKDLKIHVITQAGKKKKQINDKKTGISMIPLEEIPRESVPL